MMPRATRVSGVEKLVRIRDEVCAVGGEGVMVKYEETLLWKEAVPCITFVAGLPNRRVVESNEYSRRMLEVCMLCDRRGEFELS